MHTYTHTTAHTCTLRVPSFSQVEMEKHSVPPDDDGTCFTAEESSGQHMHVLKQSEYTHTPHTHHTHTTHTHMHTHTHAHTHTQARTHTSTHAHMHAHTHTHTTCTHACTHTHTHRCTNYYPYDATGPTSLLPLASLDGSSVKISSLFFTSTFSPVVMEILRDPGGGHQMQQSSNGTMGSTCI